MTDLLEVAKSYLEGLGYQGVWLKRLDEFTGPEGIVLRRMPETVTDRYMDRSQASDMVWQAIVVRRSEREAMETCEDLARVLRFAPLDSKNGSYMLVENDVYTQPQEMVADDEGFFAWQVQFTAHVWR